MAAGGVGVGGGRAGADVDGVGAVDRYDFRNRAGRIVCEPTGGDGNGEE
jgi:hypothetical protein